VSGDSEGDSPAFPGRLDRPAGETASTFGKLAPPGIQSHPVDCASIPAMSWCIDRHQVAAHQGWDQSSSGRAAGATGKPARKGRVDKE
jgi:hypothetical protein